MRCSDSDVADDNDRRLAAIRKRGDVMATHFRACNLCEAICGLEIQTDGPEVLSIRGDDNDPLSRGHICPKGVALQDIYSDPNRLRQPLRKTKTGDWEEVSWDTALNEIAHRTHEIRDRYGSESLAVYLGNPTVHNLGSMLFSPGLVSAIGRPQLYTATSVDQLPHHFVANAMFGHVMLIPIPDVDRTHFMLMLGANPMASNGSLMTAPGIGDRMRKIRERGGRIVLIDPRRTETAGVVDEHHFIRPGTDVWLLAAILNTVLAERQGRPDRLGQFVNGWQNMVDAVADFTPEVAAERTGVPAETIRRLAREFSESKAAVCYGRLGISTQQHGSLCQWLVNCLNIATGNFDRAGGAMFPTPAVDIIRRESTHANVGRWTTRVRQLPEFDGQLPVSALAEEILTPGDGCIRGVFTVAGNPVLSTPNGKQLDHGLQQLDLMVSIDIFLNETTRHADYILPPTTGLEVEHYDLGFHALAVRNTAKYSPITIQPDDSARADWQILSGLTKRIRPRSFGLRGLMANTIDALMAHLGPSGLVDLGLRLGPYGAWRSPANWGSGLTLKRLKDNPHGIDLGPLQPRIPECLRMPDGLIDLAPASIIDQMSQLANESTTSSSVTTDDSFALIGRRHLRSCNSWMHNSQRLTKGRNRCTVMMHPDDASRLQLLAGERVYIRSDVGQIELPLEIVDSVMPGVVSVPHGYGHNRRGTQLPIAEANSGESINDLTDDQLVDTLSGNAAFSNVRVSVCRIEAENEGVVVDQRPAADDRSLETLSRAEVL